MHTEMINISILCQRDSIIQIFRIFTINRNNSPVPQIHPSLKISFNHMIRYSIRLIGYFYRKIHWQFICSRNGKHIYARGSLSSRHDGGFDIADVVDPLVLERLRTRLNGALAGRRAADVAPILAALAEQAPADERFLLEAVSDELIAALRPDAEERLVVAGTANLARATPDFSSLGPLLDAVEEQVVLLRLFTADNGAPAGENRMRVSIGSENKDDALAEASVVTTTYGPGTGEAVAHLGVIGPTRMDYPATMTAVRAVARYLSRFLSPPET